MSRSNEDFWHFSLELYAQPQVVDLCIELQDTYHLNVNMLLWCCWLERQAIALTAERLQQAHWRVDSWGQDYVQPLRSLRRKLKQQFGTADVAIEALRQQIKQAELLAEKQMQNELAAVAAAWPQEPQGALVKGDNLRFYLTAQQLISTQLTNTMIEAAIRAFNP